MPKYLYKCQKCDAETEVYHSMSEKLTTCAQVQGECGDQGALDRIPGAVSIKRQNSSVPNEKVGSITERYIKDSKEDLKREKKNIARNRKDYENG